MALHHTPFGQEKAPGYTLPYSRTAERIDLKTSVLPPSPPPLVPSVNSSPTLHFLLPAMQPQSAQFPPVSLAKWSSFQPTLQAFPTPLWHLITRVGQGGLELKFWVILTFSTNQAPPCPTSLLQPFPTYPIPLFGPKFQQIISLLNLNLLFGHLIEKYTCSTQTAESY